MSLESGSGFSQTLALSLSSLPSLSLHATCYMLVTYLTLHSHRAHSTALALALHHAPPTQASQLHSTHTSLTAAVTLGLPHTPLTRPSQQLSQQSCLTLNSHRAHGSSHIRLTHALLTQGSQQLSQSHLTLQSHRSHGSSRLTDHSHRAHGTALAPGLPHTPLTQASQHSSHIITSYSTHTAPTAALAAAESDRR